MTDAINEVLSIFDFDKVHKAMVAVEWKWYSTNNVYTIPTRDQLVATAKRLLEGVCKENGRSVSTGGFTAGYVIAECDEKGSLGLVFRLAEIDVDVYNY